MPSAASALRSAALALLVPVAPAAAQARERIYHPPGWRCYNAAVVDPARGERWFCSEDEAVAAGWRRTKVC